MVLRSCGLVLLTAQINAQVIGDGNDPDYNGYTCPPKYKYCNGRGSQGHCCDINPDCTCDQYCPNHPEAWTTGGCAVPVAKKGKVQRGDFVCPVGYKKCSGRHGKCCDVDADCKCDNHCADRFPKGFDCSLTPGEDEYTTAGLGAKCPAGYTECSRFCDLNADCKQDKKCMAKPPPGFRCIVPKRHNGDKSAMQGGRIEVFTEKPLPFRKAQAQCKLHGGHLLSIHSNEDWKSLQRATNRARANGAILIGGYETGKPAVVVNGKVKRRSSEKWHWSDGTPMNKGMLKSIQSQNFGDNFGGATSNENQMAYCSTRCVATLLGGTSNCKKCVGLHDWGNKDRNEIEGIAGYACRVGKTASVGHLVDHRDPGGDVLYREDGALVNGKKARGWSNNEITVCGSAGTVHGPWGKDHTTVTRTFSVNKAWRMCVC